MALEQSMGRRPRKRTLPSASIAIPLVWVCLVVCVGLFAQLLSPSDPLSIDLMHRLEPPAISHEAVHLLGTDNLGRDVFSRLLHALRTSLLIAFAGVMVGLVLGTLLGLVAGHCRGLVDEAISAAIDLQASVPFLIFAIALIALFGSSFVVLLVLIGIFGWERYARLARSLSRSAIEEGYVTAARLQGAGWVWIYLRHVLPNIAPAMLVNMTLNFPEIVLLESTLSFLGLGVQPPNTSLGSMLSNGRAYLTSAWWMSVFPGLSIFLTTLSVSLIGDWLNDQLDPYRADLD